MAPRVTEAAAWRLLRAVSRDARAADCTVRDHYKPSSGVSLHVDPGGAWRTSPPASGAARDLLDLYLPLLLDPCPVIGQIGQSLDGRIATENGHSHYVTGPADIRRLHRLRALADAVVVPAQERPRRRPAVRNALNRRRPARERPRRTRGQE